MKVIQPIALSPPISPPRRSSTINTLLSKAKRRGCGRNGTARNRCRGFYRRCSAPTPSMGWKLWVTRRKIIGGRRVGEGGALQNWSEKDGIQWTLHRAYEWSHKGRMRDEGEEAVWKRSLRWRIQKANGKWDNYHEWYLSEFEWRSYERYF